MKRDLASCRMWSRGNLTATSKSAERSSCEVSCYAHLCVRNLMLPLPTHGPSPNRLRLASRHSQPIYAAVSLPRSFVYRRKYLYISLATPPHKTIPALSFLVVSERNAR